MANPVLSAIVGKNQDLFPGLLELYAKHGAKIADVTYGKGNFWKLVDTSLYEFYTSDISTGIDCRNLPYDDNSMDMVVFDPPYMHLSPHPINSDIDSTYRNNDRGYHGAKEVLLLYFEGMCEAHRVLKPKGIMVVKVMDQVESGVQYYDHITVYEYAIELGMIAEDLFVLVRNGVPMMRHKHQVHARKNHSYAWILRKL